MTDPTPRITNEIEVRVEGPKDAINGFQKWFRDEFYAWSKDNGCPVRQASPSITKRHGNLSLRFATYGEGQAFPVLDKLSQFVERKFVGLHMSGWMEATTSTHFTTLLLKHSGRDSRQCRTRL